MAIRPNRKTLTTAALSSKLDAIWRRGDQDEVSIKHIGHTLACLIADLQWNEQVDYNSMNDDMEERWLEIQSVRDHMGAVDFSKLVHRTKFGDIADHMVSHYDNGDSKLEVGVASPLGLFIKNRGE
jgi:hypothetical protein